MKRRLVQVLGVFAASALIVGCGGNGGGAGGGEASGDASGGTETTSAPAEPTYPTKNITMVVPYNPGGASDLAARTMAAAMEPELGVSIVVENRTGGAGSVGLASLAESDPDGYTIGYMPVETVMLEHNGYDIDPANYDYLGQIVSVPATVAVAANSPYQTLDDLIAAAKANPDTITVGNSGAGSIWHAATTALGKAGDAVFRPVPFDGGAPAVTAAIGGQIDAVVAGVSETAQYHKDGELRVLAVLADDPVESLPDVKTASELGIDVSIGGWGLVGAPAGLPDEVVQVLDAAVEKAVASDEYQSVISNAGNIPVWKNAADTKAFVDSEATRFAELLAELNE